MKLPQLTLRELLLLVVIAAVCCAWWADGSRLRSRMKQLWLLKNEDAAFKLGWCGGGREEQRWWKSQMKRIDSEQGTSYLADLAAARPFRADAPALSEYESGRRPISGP